MPINANLTRFEYTGDGTTTAFPIGCEFWKHSEFIVQVNGVTKTLTTDYTISPTPTGFVPATSGTCTFVVPPPLGQSVLIRRRVSRDQEVDHAINGLIDSDRTDYLADKTRAIQQEQDTAIERCIRVDDRVVGLTRTALNYLEGGIVRWRTGTQKILESVPLGRLGSINIVPLPLGISDGGTQRTNVADARTNLGVPGLTTVNAFRGTNSFSDTITLIKDATSSLRLQTTTTSPSIDLYKNANVAAGPVRDELGQIDFTANNASGAKVTFGFVDCIGTDGTAGSVDGVVRLVAVTNSVAAAELVAGGGVTMGNASAKGTGSLNVAGGIYRGNGRPVGETACFHAHKNGSNQTATSNTATKVTFGTAAWNVGSYYNTTTRVFTPPAGRYRITRAVNFNGTSGVDNEALRLALYKNGAEHKRIETTRGSAAGNDTCWITVTVEANGTDTFEMYVTKAGTGNGTMDGTAAYTWFEASAL